MKRRRLGGRRAISGGSARNFIASDPLFGRDVQPIRIARGAARFVVASLPPPPPHHPLRP